MADGAEERPRPMEQARFEILCHAPECAAREMIVTLTQAAEDYGVVVDPAAAGAE